MFNTTTECYFAEEEYESVVDDVDNDESAVDKVDNDDSHITELGAKEDMNEGKEIATDPNTSQASKTSIPNLVEEEKNLNPQKIRDQSKESNDTSDKVTPQSPTCDDQNIERMETAVATLPKVVPEKPGQQTNLRSRDDTPDKETPQSPSTTTIEDRNLERTAIPRTTLETVLEEDPLQKKVSTTNNPQVEYNTKLRQRKDLPGQPTKHRRKRKRKGGRLLNDKDLEDDDHV
eukprot:scaffold125456_cov29-Attheya_sp.AAC.1